MSGSEVFFKVLGGERPSKPANALELGLSDEVWKLLEDCWQTDRISRPSVRDVSDRVKGAASVCGILSSVGVAPQRYEDPDSDFGEFGRSLSHLSSEVKLMEFVDQLFTRTSSGELHVCRALIPRGLGDEDLGADGKHVPGYLSPSPLNESSFGLIAKS